MIFIFLFAELDDGQRSKVLVDYLLFGGKIL